MKFELTIKLEGKEYVRMGDVLGQAKEEGFTKKYVKESLETTKIKGLGNGLFVLYEDVKNFLAMNTSSDLKVEFEESLREGDFFKFYKQLGYKVYTIKNGIKTEFYDGCQFVYDMFCDMTKEDIYNQVRPISFGMFFDAEKKGYSNEEELRKIVNTIYLFFRSEEVITRAKEIEQKLKDRFNKKHDEDEEINNTYNEDKSMYKKMYKKLAMSFHPDKGGTEEDMVFVNKLKEDWGI